MNMENKTVENKRIGISLPKQVGSEQDKNESSLYDLQLNSKTDVDRDPTIGAHVEKKMAIPGT